MLTISAQATRAEVVVLRRGSVVVGDGEAAKRLVEARLARLCALDAVSVVFEDGVTGELPGPWAYGPYGP